MTALEGSMKTSEGSVKTIDKSMKTIEMSVRTIGAVGTVEGSGKTIVSVV